MAREKQKKKQKKKNNNNKKAKLKNQLNTNIMPFKKNTHMLPLGGETGPTLLKRMRLKKTSLLPN